MALDLVTFNAIPVDTLDGDNLARLTAMRNNLEALAVTWNALAAAGAPNDDNATPDVISARTAAIAKAHQDLKDSKFKLVDLTGIEPAKIVHLGGSRKRRQSKKRKNQRKHNNNQ